MRGKVECRRFSCNHFANQLYRAQRLILYLLLMPLESRQNDLEFFPHKYTRWSPSHCLIVTTVVKRKSVSIAPSINSFVHNIPKQVNIGKSSFFFSDLKITLVSKAFIVLLVSSIDLIYNTTIDCSTGHQIKSSV